MRAELLGLLLRLAPNTSRGLSAHLDSYPASEGQGQMFQDTNIVLFYRIDKNICKCFARRDWQ